MIKDFCYSNITFKKEDKGDCLVVRGEIKNASAKNYSAVVFRINLFIKGTPPFTTNMVINGLNTGQTHTFEKPIEELGYNKVIGSIVNYEIFAESGY